MSVFRGYERENGRVGTRNHVLIIPLDDLSNSASLAVENNVFGTRAIPHPYGRLQFGRDLDLTFKTLNTDITATSLFLYCAHARARPF